MRLAVPLHIGEMHHPSIFSCPLIRDKPNSIKTSAQRARLNSTLCSGHSLRTGFATAATRAGAEEKDIASVIGHKSKGVLHRYIRIRGDFSKLGAEVSRVMVMADIYAYY